ncbi:quinoprotein relay system zinc metallohydrolase 2 [Methylobacillus glycogenes]|uniref:quinoprotein relay system zinc metallohydrolase 2 n=1 Tax=Methylobacillus glycogenes TaxID=406 RepID=UPI0004719E8E|nr:quinoprotein relay system zinc metallohydrolase 2 [Methylobacillus glycogenes]
MHFKPAYYYKLLVSLVFLLAAASVVAADFSLEQVANGVYVHYGVHEDLDDGYHGDISNIGFIIGSKGVAVIDSGGSLKTGQRLRAALREITALPILYVINTHIHPDHIFGNAAFLADQPQFIGHEKLANAMELRKPAYLKQGQQLLHDDFVGSDIIKPTVSVAQSLVLDLGQRKLLLQAYPNAHTNTDLTVFDETSATLWTGDLLFIERTPSLDGDIKGWLKALDQLQQLKNIKQAVPGHGPVTRDFSSALNHEARYLNLLLEDIRAAIKQGKTMEQTMDSAAQAESGNWQLFNAVNRRNINLLYPALEWE